MAKEKTEETAVATLPVMAPLSVADLIEVIRATQQPQGGISPEQLQQVLESTAQSTRKALKPENEAHPDVSVFNPKGQRDNPKDKLRYKTYWANTELYDDELSPEEIALFNSVEHTLEARNGSWRAELRRTGSDGKFELHINFPHSNTDDRMNLPNGMNLIMMELLGGTRAVDAVSLAQQVAELQTQLKQLAAGQLTA